MSIRLRLAAVFAITFAVLLALGGWLFVTALSSSLMTSVDAQLASQAAQAGQYLRSPGSAKPAPAVAGNPPEFTIQVIDRTGRVRAGSEEAGRRPILSPADLRAARSGRVLVTRRLDDERERILAQPLPSRPGWVAVAGASLESTDSTISRVTTELAIGGSVIVVVTALGAYGLATAALRPVERLRREVAAIAERGAPSTVAVPPTHDEIATLAETMNDLLVQLQHALQRERNLVADTSHELRTPFAVLQAELELAARPGRSRAELVEAVTNASEEAARLSRLADDLLLLSRSDQGEIPLRPEPTDLGALLRASADRASGRARPAGVTCRVEVPEGSVVATIDPGRMSQAVDNLVDNALRFAPTGTEVVLTARADGTDLVVEVADDGPGFTTDFLPHAFERFRRPDASRSREGGGAGLGLAIVRAIALAHGGRAAADNRPDGGACVRLTLPRAVTAGDGVAVQRGTSRRGSPPGA